MGIQLDISSTLPADSRKWWAMLGIGMGVFMSTLDSSIVNISLLTLEEQLHTDFPTIQWVILSYLLVITSMMLGVARLGDMLGKKKLYVTGLGLFTLGSLLCGLSPGVGWLIGFRALQGTGAVMMTALGSAIITEVFPSSERGRALGMMGGIVSIGIALGPTIGGVLIGLVHWRSIFLVNVPVGLAAVVIVSRVVPASPPGEQGQRFDVVGALVMLATLICYALGMTMGQRQGFDGTILALLAAAVVGLVIFLVIESRLDQPMVDLQLFKNVLFGVNLLMGFLVFIVLAGQFLMPYFLDLVQGYRTEQIGLLIAVMPVSMGLVAPASGALSDRLGSRIISLAGLLVVAGACLLIGTTLRADITPVGYLVRLAPLGVGIGLFQSPNNSAILGAAPRKRLGIASGLLSLSRTLGQSSGVPLMGALFAANVAAVEILPAGADITAASPEALVFGVRGAFQIAALVILTATVLAAFALWFDGRQEKANSAGAE